MEGSGNASSHEEGVGILEGQHRQERTTFGRTTNECLWAVNDLHWFLLARIYEDSVTALGVTDLRSVVVIIFWVNHCSWRSTARKSHNRTPTSPPEYVQKYIQQTLCKWDHLSGSLANAPSLFNIRALPASRTVPDQREVRGRGGRRGLRPSHGFSRAKKGRLAGSTFLGDPFSRQGCEQNLPRWSICSIRNALKISYFFLRDFIGINEEILHI